jgi:hypothetical protein
MAVQAIKAPTFQSNPINGAQAVVNKIERRTPRTVFDDPKSALPSDRVVFPSSGCGNVFPRIFAAITGVPLATVSNTSNCDG